MNASANVVRVAADKPQGLRILEGRFVVEHVDDARPAPEGGDWLSSVHAPDGWTIIRRDDEAGDAGWTALWSGDEPHDPLATGMLDALDAPLAAAEVPVMVASAFTADVVLVPAGRLDAAVDVLRAAGHRVS